MGGNEWVAEEPKTTSTVDLRDERESEKKSNGDTVVVQNGAIKDPTDEKALPQTLGKGISPDYPKPNLELEDRYIDEPRSLRVAVIGAGLAGITAAVLLPVKVPGVQLTVFEKNADVSGTWLENTYPGVQCDIPSLVYQSTIHPNPSWTEKFARGSEIRDYWQDLARKYDVYRYVKLEHHVEQAIWDEDSSVWRVSVKNLKKEVQFVFDADVVITAIGRFNAWKIPDFPGIDKYKGLLRHASQWDPEFDLTDKSVAVIGNGASGIQLTANIQTQVKRLDHYARSKTWIAASWAGDERTLEPMPFSEKERAAMSDPEEYVKLRKEIEEKYWRRCNAYFRGSEMNLKMREQFVEIMKDRLVKKPELLERLVPDFSPNCRRLTPGPGYLEALTEENVRLIQTPIKEITETGIVTDDGVHRAVDAIYTATGANSSMAPPFPIIAFGKNLSETWRHGSKEGFPRTYMGHASPGFPNLFFLAGPHGTGFSGTVPHSAEVQVTHYAKILRKLSTEGIRTITVSEKATREFQEYSTAFFARTTLTDHCSSWYNGGKAGGRIHGVWPGSAVHLTLARKEPRWEDYEYEYLGGSSNRFAWWFGNGWTKAEQDPKVDLVAYLRTPGELDLRGHHERWWEWP